MTAALLFLTLDRDQSTAIRAIKASLVGLRCARQSNSPRWCQRRQHRLIRLRVQEALALDVPRELLCIRLPALPAPLPALPWAPDEDDDREAPGRPTWDEMHDEGHSDD